MSIRGFRLRTIGALAALLVSVTSSRAFAQEAPTLRIEEVDAMAAEPFSLIRGLRELSDGRVIVTDWIEERVVVVDLASGTSRDLGRVGGGPKEFRMPSRLIALPADSTLLIDFGNARLTVIGPRLNFVRTLSMYAHGERFRMSPSAVDAEGVMYFALSPFAAGPGRTDSVPIARWAPGYERVRMMASVQLKAYTSRKRRISLQPGIPLVMFAKQDGWAVAPDGWLAVVRSEPYRVEWYGPSGERVLGPTIPYQILPVTMDDRRDYIRLWLQRTARSGRGENGGMGHVPAEEQTPQEVDRLARTEEFAEVFPPLEAGGVWPASDGRLWVQRLLPADSLPTFDVFDRSGAREAVVKLPARRRLVGFGSATLYATVADDDDLLTLERYRLPALVAGSEERTPGTRD